MVHAPQQPKELRITERGLAVEEETLVLDRSPWWRKDLTYDSTDMADTKAFQDALAEFLDGTGTTAGKPGVESIEEAGS